MAGCAPLPLLLAGYALRVMQSDTTCETLGLHQLSATILTGCDDVGAEVGEASIAPGGFLMNAGARPWPLLFSQGQFQRIQLRQESMSMLWILRPKLDRRVSREAASRICAESGSSNSRPIAKGGVCSLFNRRYCGAIHFESWEDFQPVIPYTTCKVLGHIDVILRLEIPNPWLLNKHQHQD